MALPIGELVDAASGLLFAALAVAVWRIGPAREANRRFAAFAAAFAGVMLVGNLALLFAFSVEGVPGTIAWAFAIAAVALDLLAVALMVRLIPHLPWPTTEDERATSGAFTVLPTAAMVLFFLLAVGGPLVRGNAWGIPEVPPLPGVVAIVGFYIVAAGVGYLAAWMPIRYAQADDQRQPHQAAFLGVALALWPVFFISIEMGDPARTVEAALGGVVLIATLAGLWLWATQERGGGPARVAAWLVLGIALAGMLAGARWGATTVQGSGLNALARAVAVLVIAYAILRHQLLGIDVTVRKGIRRSTLAAVFVAVFFVASEGAQVLFAGVADGNEWIGVLAAGALVLVLAPLQRFAESVADAAVPYAADPDEMGDGERLELYRRQAEVAWSDGALSPDERAMLDDLKDELGIGDSQAAAVESAVAEGVGGEG